MLFFFLYTYFPSIDYTHTEMHTRYIYMHFTQFDEKHRLRNKKSLNNKIIHFDIVNEQKL